MSKKLSQAQLKKIMQLEIKKIMDEDSLMPPPKLGEPYYKSYFKEKNPRQNYGYYDTDDHECDVCSAKKHITGCECDICSMQNIGIFEGCGCGGSSKNPYEAEREEDYSFMQRSADVDPMIDNLLDMGAKSVDIDWKDKDDHHEHSSYMARPQLRKIAKYASKLLDMIDENEELEDWQESKIAQMAQMIGDVYHSIEYDEDYEEETSDDDLDINDLIGMIRTGNI